MRSTSPVVLSLFINEQFTPVLSLFNNDFLLGRFPLFCPCLTAGVAALPLLELGSFADKSQVVPAPAVRLLCRCFRGGLLLGQLGLALGFMVG
jgi:hypothetical protein